MAVAACAEWEAVERRMVNLHEPVDRLTDGEIAELLGPLETRLVSLLGTMTTLAAATAAGVHARARLLASHNRASEFSWDEPVTMAGQLAEHALRLGPTIPKRYLQRGRICSLTGEACSQLVCRSTAFVNCTCHVSSFGACVWAEASGLLRRKGGSQ